MTRRMGRPLGWGATAAAVLLLVSCGGDGDAAGTTIAQQAAASTPPDAVICREPPPTEVALGSTTASEVVGFDQCFLVQVPAGESSITIELTGLTDSLNLKVGYSDPDTIRFNTGEFWQSTEDGTADELVVIENPQPGPYYINVAVGTFRNMSPFTLSVRTP